MCLFCQPYARVVVHVCECVFVRARFDKTFRLCVKSLVHMCVRRRRASPSSSLFCIVRARLDCQ